MEICLYSAKYFLRPYEDDDYLSSVCRVIQGFKYIVYRPNHGLCHSIRQGFLARDIITLIMKDLNHPLHSWVIECIAKDKYFEVKTAILSSFQRSGRQSEISSSENPSLYAKYERNDRYNFIDGIDPCYFNDDSNEIERWSYALIWNSDNNDLMTDNLRIILKAAHTLDLRRIPKFDADRVKRETSNILMIEQNSRMLKILWNQSGKYLNISGDRDMVNNRTDWEDRFFTLQNDPAKLYFSLRKGKLTC